MFVYGMAASSFAEYARIKYDLIFTEAEAEEFRRIFFSYPDGYYGLLDFHEEMRRTVKRDGFVRSPIGRKRRLPMIYSESFKERSEAERQAINFPVQSFSSDLGLIAMMLMHRELKSNPKLSSSIKLLWYIHDAIMYRAKEKYLLRANELLRECMEVRAPEYVKKKFGVSVDYPVVSDGKAGYSWASMAEI